LALHEQRRTAGLGIDIHATAIVKFRKKEEDDHSITGVDVPYPAPVRRALATPFGLFRCPGEDR
jgi:hypothetical protein